MHQKEHRHLAVSSLLGCNNTVCDCHEIGRFGHSCRTLYSSTRPLARNVVITQFKVQNSNQHVLILVSTRVCAFLLFFSIEHNIHHTLILQIFYYFDIHEIQFVEYYNHKYNTKIFYIWANNQGHAHSNTSCAKAVQIESHLVSQQYVSC